MLPVRGFIVGFTLGFGSGMVFRALAESDFEPLKEVLKTTIGVAQKVGDAAADTYGRLVENIEDLRSQLRAERVRVTVPQARPEKPTHPEHRARPSRVRAAHPKTKTKSRASTATGKRAKAKRKTHRAPEKVLHA
jgi:hypothetical protein